MHIILLGDSIFDNRTYVEAHEPDVRQQLAKVLPSATVTLLALDGSTTQGIPRQAHKIPSDATHLVMSVGGNDLLGHYHILTQSTQTMFDALLLMANLRQTFHQNYATSLEILLAKQLPVTLCTLYYPNYAEAILQEAAKIAVAIFNDVIWMLGAEYNLPIIELRQVCTEPSDYANPIEPSAQGGEKIAKAIDQSIQATLG